MTDCVLHQGYKDRAGYGKSHGQAVHRRVYERQVGPIPAGMTVDHLCFTPACINPAHMRLLTPSENAMNQRSAFKTHCVNGHEFTPENTYRRPVKYRQANSRDCRKCIAAAQRRYQARIRGIAA